MSVRLPAERRIYLSAPGRRGATGAPRWRARPWLRLSPRRHGPRPHARPHLCVLARERHPRAVNAGHDGTLQIFYSSTLAHFRGAFTDSPVSVVAGAEVAAAGPGVRVVGPQAGRDIILQHSTGPVPMIPIDLRYPYPLRPRTTRERMIAHSRTFAARLAAEIRIVRAARPAGRRRRRLQRASEWRQATFERRSI